MDETYWKPLSPRNAERLVMVLAAIVGSAALEMPSYGRPPLVTQALNRIQSGKV